jgi:NhaP-type Na+/H+ or K+/H+ antiporter
MAANGIAVIMISLIFAGTLFGVFKTKTQGFGKYTTSTLVLVLVLFVGSISLALGKVEWQPLSSLLLAVAGYAGGLVAGARDRSGGPDTR